MRFWSRLFCLVIAAQLFGALDAAADVKARQGEAPQKTFKSPMILELPYVVADPQYWGVGDVRTADNVTIRTYVCESVSFRDLAMAADRTNSDMRLTFFFMLYDEPGVDKLVNVTFEVVRNEDVLASATERAIKVGEKKTATRRVSTTVPAMTLTADPRPMLRITVEVHDNP